MATMIINTRFKYDEETCESFTKTLSIKMSARVRNWVSKNRRKYLKELLEDGILAESRCDCSHCQNDWDCCGRFVGRGATIEMVGTRRVLVHQVFQQNI